MKYQDLEKKHDLHDVLAPEKYGHKVHLMKVVLKDLRRHRGRIQGRDMMPGYDEARLWSTIVSSYSLLEQSLKMLVGVRTVDYLPPARGKDTAIGDGHNLMRVYKRLTELDKEILEEAYAQYASFIEFPSEFPTLRSYLTTIGRGQVPWRYFLLERDFDDLSGLPSPLSPDMLLEVVHALISILMAKSWNDHGSSNIYSRVEWSLRDALLHPSPLEQLSTEDLSNWTRDGNGVVNAFSRYLRAGPLDDYSDAMRKWLDDSVAAVRAMASREGENDVDLLRFLDVSKRCCVTFRDNRFSFRNYLPLPLSSLNTHGGWTIEWHSESATWQGPVDDVKELPLRPGQSFAARWHSDAEGPTRRDMMPGQGRLVVRRNARTLASLNVHLFSVGTGGWGSVDLNREDGPVNSATFVVSDRDGAFPEKLADLTCMTCLGTGFCPECRGESLAGSCRNCPTADGLCPECLGYGRDGNHIIASTAA